MTHVTLHLLSYEEAEKILRLQHDDEVRWAAGYPSTEQLDYLQAYLVELRTAPARYNWQSQLRRRSDGLVIGGAGVSGPPDDRGAVAIGYEIEPSLPDEGFGGQIVGALLDVATGMGAQRAVTSTRLNDPIRQLAYLEAGLNETSRSADGIRFEVDLS